jgi:hypothetical protein
LVQVLEMSGELADGEFADGVGLTIQLHDPHADELSATGHEFLEQDLVWRRALAGRGLQAFCEVGQDAGIEAVVLGQDAQGLRELADACGLNHRDGDAGVEQFEDGQSLVAAGGFDGQASDDAGREALEMIQELSNSLGRVGESNAADSRHRREIGQETSDVEAVFGDIDADEESIYAE